MSDAREQPAAQPQKKRMSRGTLVLVIIVCVLLAIALILVATVLILSAVGRNALTNDDGVNIARDDVEALGSGTVRYNGQLYRYNTDIVTILLMGVDEEVKQDTGGVYGNANQSDANILAVLDMRNQELTLVSISRDAMCTLDVLDSTGAHVGTATAQLALAYSYGDGAERSCELTSAAVSRLFYDLPIPAYGSIYMQGIRQLVDSVGGVTVTPDASFSGFTARTARDAHRSAHGELYPLPRRLDRGQQSAHAAAEAGRARAGEQDARAGQGGPGERAGAL